MENEIIDLLKAKNLSENSINLYLKNLKRLSGSKDIKNLNFLNNKEEIMNKLDNYKDTTKRNYLISIVSVLKCLKDKQKKYNKLYKLYTEEMMTADNTIKESVKNGDKTPNQKINWINWDDVIKTYNNIDISFINKKNINEGQYNKLLDYVVLSLYVLLPPRRNEYKDMYIVKKFSNDLDKNKNYFIIDDKEFLFNNYKTKNKFGVQQIKIDDDLFNVLMAFIKHHPLIKGKINKNLNVPLLVDFEGKHLNKINSITKILNRIFNKNIGASMLRHSYLSSKYADIKEEQKEDAELMAHSVNEQNKTYIKN